MGKIKILLIAIILFLGLSSVFAIDIEDAYNSTPHTLISSNNSVINVQTRQKTNNLKVFLICLIPAVITATIVFAVYYNRNKMVRKSHYATNYLVKESINIINGGRSYMGTSTSKRKRPGKQ